MSDSSACVRRLVKVFPHDFPELQPFNDNHAPFSRTQNPEYANALGFGF